MRDRYTEIDTLVLRQLLGDVSHDDVKELNRVVATKKHYFTKAWDEPAKINVWDTFAIGGLLLGGFAFGTYGVVIRRYNLLWLLAAPIPAAYGLLVNYMRQDIEANMNAYRYLLTKRAAIVEYECNSSKVASSDKLSKLLASNGATLYDIES